MHRYMGKSGSILSFFRNGKCMYDIKYLSGKPMGEWRRWSGKYQYS